MIRSPLYWRLLAGGICLLLAGLLLGSAAASGRLGAAVFWVLVLLAGAGVGFSAGRLARRTRGLLTRAAALGASVPPAAAGDEFAQLETLLEENEARFAEQVQQLRAERNQLTAVLGGMVEGVIAINLERRVLHLNAVAAKWFGCSEPVLAIGRPIYELSRQPEVAGAMIEAIEKRRQVSRAFTLTRSPGQDGGPNRIELNASPLLSPRGDGELVEGAVAVIHDITELERLETVRRDFVSNVSHELKTPLTAIHGYVETLLDAGPVDGATRSRFLRKIRRQSNRLSALVSDLLSLSRIESAAEQPEKIVDLRVPAGEVLGLLRTSGEERGLELTADLPRVPVRVLGEEEAIRQALSNLVDNAVKYSSTGGRVMVRLQAENGRAVLEVEDQGPGIASEHLDRIFERFYRVDRARSRELGGTGLGLAIVKNVAIRHGGGVDVKSERGRGSTFRFWLPVAD